MGSSVHSRPGATPQQSRPVMRSTAMDDATDARELAAQYLETARLLVSQFGERAEEYATQCSRSAETQEEWGEAVVWLKLRDAAFRLGTQSGGVARHRLH